MAGKVICIAQQKGGAGKTTLCAHLAVAWAKARKSVAVIDIDPQQSLAMWHELRAEQLGENDTSLTMEQVTGWRTRTAVDRLKQEHDVVVIDSPPHAETEAKIAVRAADLVVVPVQPSPMDVWATRPTLDMAASEKTPALLVYNRVPPRAKLTEAILARVKQDFDVKPAKQTVGNRVAFAASLNEGRTSLETAPSSLASREVRALAKEILRAAS